MAVSEAPISTRPYSPRSPLTDWSNRLSRCVLGLALFGAGDALILQAELGAAPWDMFHKGIARHLDIPIGTVIVAMGFVVLVAWIPLRQRPGIGTILNALEIGLVVDLVQPHLPDTGRLLPRFAFLIVGVVVVGIGSGFYIGAGLGTGPRDGLMLGISRRGPSLRVARTVIELVVGIGGIVLGIRPGIGTLVFLIGIGPLVQLFLPRLSLPPRRAAGVVGADPMLSPDDADDLTRFERGE